jgi:hypothetical protein
VAVGDYNDDGFDDLFITYWGQNVLYRNNVDGTFTDVTKEAGLLITFQGIVKNLLRKLVEQQWGR